MQRGSTAAAALDAIAAISRVVAFECFRGDAERVAINIATPLDAAHSIWGKVRKGSGPGEPGHLHHLLPAQRSVKLDFSYLWRV